MPSSSRDDHMTASATGSVPDPNLATTRDERPLTGFDRIPMSNRGQSSLSARSRAPFRSSIHLGNSLESTAHDVAVDDRLPARTDRRRSLPEGCVSPVTGQVFCHATRSRRAPPVQHALWSPSSWRRPPSAYGSLAVSATVSESEPDFDQGTNYATAVRSSPTTFTSPASADDGAGSLRQAILDAKTPARRQPLHDRLPASTSRSSDAVENDPHHDAAAGLSPRPHSHRRRRRRPVPRRHQPGRPRDRDQRRRKSMATGCSSPAAASRWRISPSTASAATASPSRALLVGRRS